MDDEFLLRLYRLARESDPGGFQAAAVGLLRKSLHFQAAFWGEGAVRPGSTGAVLESAHLDEVDPQFVTEWRALHHRGRLIPVAVNDRGRALEVRTAHFYAAEPARAALHAKFGMRSYSFTSDFSPDGLRCRWLNLYRSDPDASGARDDLARVQWAMPHLGEALRIHRAIHCEAGSLGTEESGSLIRVRESTAAGVVALDAAASARRLPITARQHEIAMLYARGWSHKEVARTLGLSPATVRNHLAAVYSAMRVHSRRQLWRALGPSRPTR